MQTLLACACGGTIEIAVTLYITCGGLAGLTACACHAFRPKQDRPGEPDDLPEPEQDKPFSSRVCEVFERLNIDCSPKN